MDEAEQAFLLCNHLQERKSQDPENCFLPGVQPKQVDADRFSQHYYKKIQKKDFIKAITYVISSKLGCLLYVKAIPVCSVVAAQMPDNLVQS